MIKKILTLFVACVVGIGSGRAQTEYVVDAVKGHVEYDTGSGWQEVRRLVKLPASSFLRVEAGASLTVYNPKSPQQLVIDMPGEQRLRKLAEAARKKAAQARGNVLASLTGGKEKGGKVVSNGVGFRCEGDNGILLVLAKAVASPVHGDTPVRIDMKENEGFYIPRVANSTDSDLYAALIVNVGGYCSAMSLSGDITNQNLLVVPFGSDFEIPFCSIVPVEGLRAFLVVADRPFDVANLCMVLNNPGTDGGNASDGIRAMAVEARFNP